MSDSRPSLRVRLAVLFMQWLWGAVPADSRGAFGMLVMPLVGMVFMLFGVDVNAVKAELERRRGQSK